MIRLPLRTAKSLNIELTMKLVPSIFFASSSIQKGWMPLHSDSICSKT